MVAAVVTPLQRSAQQLFTSDDTPEELQWIHCLSPLHLRLFVVDLHRALSSALIHERSGDTLREVIEDWKATAEVDANPDLAKKLRTPRSKKTYRVWEPAST